MIPISALVSSLPVPESPRDLYLDLVKRTLTRTVTAQHRERHTLRPRHPLKRMAIESTRRMLEPLALELVKTIRPRPEDYLESNHESRNRAEDAETMVGIRQLDNLQACITNVLASRVEGDLLEAGVWRGGIAIFMRAVLKAYGVTNRKVWVTDSFEGLPEPEHSHETYGWKRGDMAVSLQEVQANFARYGLLDSQVEFLKGFFATTLPQAPIGKLAVLRIDADLYASTRDALTLLYPKLSVGGYAIFDDYQNLADCRRAIDEYRAAHGITEPLVPIDSRAAFWRRVR